MQQQTAGTVEVKGTGMAAAILIEGDAAAAGLSGGRIAESERRRVEAVVETLANLRNGGESLAEVAHDARNMVTALGLYCDLLEEPGVLSRVLCPLCQRTAPGGHGQPPPGGKAAGIGSAHRGRWRLTGPSAAAQPRVESARGRLPASAAPSARATGI